MRLSDREIDGLRDEAQRTYYEYGRIRRLYRANRNDSSLKSRLLELQEHYERLKHLISGTHPDLEDLKPYCVDLSRLEPSKPRVHSPLAYRRENVGPPWHRRILRAGLRVRFAVLFVGLVVALAVFLLIANQDLGLYEVPTSSMEPTLLPDDHFIAYSAKSYGRGQVVVIRDPEDAAGYLVKRIVGLAGDVVEVRNGCLIVNGDPVAEPYLHERMTYELSPVRVGPDEVFLLGDNRNHSYDSHIWKRGVLIEVIMGSVRQIYSPRSRMQTRIAYTDVFAHVKAGAVSQDERQARVSSY